MGVTVGYTLGFYSKETTGALRVRKSTRSSNFSITNSINTEQAHAFFFGYQAESQRHTIEMLGSDLRNSFKA